MRIVLFLTIMLAFMSCETKKEFSTNPKDYEAYLSTEAPKTTSKYFNLWNSKISSDSIQLLSLGNVAGEYDRYFKNTGNIDYLKKAEKALDKAVEIAAINKSGYYRALARNYISQHRFKEALGLAQSARALGSGLKKSQSLLFDIHMELGNYQTAHKYLDSIYNLSDFGYLIRAAKWNDHKGDLDTTIAFMERALDKAKSAKNKTLLVWTYANLGDYYGHAGRIEDSYNNYLKTLSLEPNNAHVKKGIAWIVFSHEKNGEEALRILDAIDQNYRSPDHFLLKAEIAQYMNDEHSASYYLDDYFKMVQNQDYGNMYNAHNIKFYIDKLNNYEKAIALARKEVTNRATPETYSLLAHAYLKKGDKERALQVVEEHVLGKTFEPAVLLRTAQVYKALGKKDELASLREELFGAFYELGPLAIDKIKKL